MTRLYVCLALLLSSACAHDVVFTSDPPGAEVLVDGERVGVTPVTWTESSSHEGRVTVEVRRGTTEARFALKREGLAPSPIVAGAGFGVLSLLIGSAMIVPGYAAFLIGLVVAPGAPPALALSLVGLVVTLAGAALAGAAWQTPFVVVSEAGRVSPDAVHVDFLQGAVRTTPADGWEDLIGTTKGHVPLQLGGTSPSPPGDAPVGPSVAPAQPELAPSPSTTEDPLPADDAPDESRREQPQALPDDDLSDLPDLSALPDALPDELPDELPDP